MRASSPAAFFDQPEAPRKTICSEYGSPVRLIFIGPLPEIRPALPGSILRKPCCGTIFRLILSARGIGQQKGALSDLLGRQRALYQKVKPGFDLLTRKFTINQPLFPTSSLC